MRQKSSSQECQIKNSVLIGMPTHSKPLFVILALVIVVILAGLVRGHHLFKNPTWMDEYCTILGAAGIVGSQDNHFGGRVSIEDKDSPVYHPAFQNKIGTLPEILGDASFLKIPDATLFWDKGNGLLFNYLVNIWSKVSGFSDIGLKLLPLLFGLAGICLTFAISREVYSDNRIALFSAILVASNSYLIEFSQELRPYSAGIFFALLAVFAFIKLSKNPIKSINWVNIFITVSFAISLTCLFFTHYLLFPWIAISLGLGVLFTPNKKLCALAFLLGGTIISTLFCIWYCWGASLGFLAMKSHDVVWLEHAAKGDYAWWLTPFSFRDGLRILVERTVQYNVPFFQFLSFANFFNALLLLLLILSLCTLVIKVLKSEKTIDKTSFLLILLASCGGVFNFILAMRSGHTLPFIDRYFILYLPFQSIILSGLLLLVKKPFLRWPTVAFAAVFILFFSKMFFSNLQREMVSSEPKEASLDALVSQLPQSAKVSFSAKSIYSALVVALKIKDAGGENISIQVNPGNENGAFSDAP